MDPLSALVEVIFFSLLLIVSVALMNLITAVIVDPSPATRVMLAEVEAGEVYRTILLPEQCSRNGYTGTTTVLETF